jgi:hypothetical protein
MTAVNFKLNLVRLTEENAKFQAAGFHGLSAEKLASLTRTLQAPQVDGDDLTAARALLFGSTENPPRVVSPQVLGISTSHLSPEQMQLANNYAAAVGSVAKDLRARATQVRVDKLINSDLVDTVMVGGPAFSVALYLVNPPLGAAVGIAALTTNLVFGVLRTF